MKDKKLEQRRILLAERINKIKQEHRHHEDSERKVVLRHELSSMDEELRQVDARLKDKSIIPIVLAMLMVAALPLGYMFIDSGITGAAVTRFEKDVNLSINSSQTIEFETKEGRLTHLSVTGQAHGNGSVVILLSSTYIVLNDTINGSINYTQHCEETCSLNETGNNHSLKIITDTEFILNNIVYSIYAANYSLDNVTIIKNATYLNDTNITSIENISTNVTNNATTNLTVIVPDTNKSINMTNTTAPDDAARNISANHTRNLTTNITNPTQTNITDADITINLTEQNETNISQAQNESISLENLTDTPQNVTEPETDNETNVTTPSESNRTAIPQNETTQPEPTNKTAGQPEKNQTTENHPPAGQLPSIQTEQNSIQRIRLTEHIKDPDKDALSFRAASQDITAQVRGPYLIIEADREGDFEVIVTATDEIHEKNFTMKVKTIPADHPPKASSIPALKMEPNMIMSLDLSRYFTDPEGEELSYETSSDMAETEGSTLIIRAPKQLSETTIGISASDREHTVHAELTIEPIRRMIKETRTLDDQVITSIRSSTGGQISLDLPVRYEEQISSEKALQVEDTEGDGLKDRASWKDEGDFNITINRSMVKHVSENTDIVDLGPFRKKITYKDSVNEKTGSEYLPKAGASSIARIGFTNNKGLNASFNSTTLELTRWNTTIEVQLSREEAGIESYDTNSTLNYTDHAKRIMALEPDLKNEAGGIEFDILLFEHTERNRFSFGLDTQNLEFFYQPPLDEEFQDSSCNATDCRGSHRPEDVVGSYAAYQTGPGKRMAGKAYHIYRPKIYDAEGDWIWGELDIEDSTLTVTAEQAWLDSAAYPVTIDPMFGYTTAGGSSETIDNYKAGSNYTLTERGTIKNITAHISYTHLIAGGWGFGIYNSTKDLMTQTSPYSASSSFTGWSTLSVAIEKNLTSGDHFIVAGGQTGPGGSITLSYDSGGDGGSQSHSGGTFPDPWSPTTNSNMYSVYAGYEAYVPPVNYSEFTGNETTNFSAVPDITSVPEATLHKDMMMKLSWNSNINAMNADFDTHVRYGQGWLSLDAQNFHENINSTANITFYNLSFSEVPTILMDGSLCPADICSILNWNGTSIEFNVSHFTNYSVGSNSNLTIYDQADPEAGSQDAKTFDQISFYADYVNITSQESIRSMVLLMNTSDFDGDDETYAAELFDYDQDSARDEIALGTRGSDRFLTFWRNGTQIWNDYSNSYTTYEIRSQDINNDGDDELVVASSQGLTVFYKNGTLYWQAGTDAITSLDIADLDGDGELEIAALGYNANLTYAYETDGTQMWNSSVSAVLQYELITGDIDADGSADEIISIEYGQAVIHDGDGTGLFNISIVRPRAVAVADIDHDGYNDEIILGGRYGNLYAFRWDGISTSLSSGDAIWSTTEASTYIREIAVTDLDEDGFEDDILIGDEDGYLIAYDNNSIELWNHTFTSAENIYAIWADDMDGDGHVDVAYATSGTNSGELYIVNRTGDISYSYNISKGDIGQGGGRQAAIRSSPEYESDSHLIVVASTGGHAHLFSATACKIRFDGENQWRQMDWNKSGYEYNRTFSSTGSYDYNISCDGSLKGYEELNATDSITVTDGPPVVDLSSPPNASTQVSPVTFQSAIDDNLNVVNATLYTNETAWNAVETRWNGEVVYNDTGLVALYHFNNQTDFGDNESYYYDWSRNGNNGTCELSDTLCPAVVSGQFGTAVDIAGTNKLNIEVPASDSINNLSSFTWMAWLNIGSYSNDDGDSSFYIARKGDSGKLLRYNLSGHVRGFVQTTGSFRNTETSDTLNLNQWIQVVMTYNQSSNLVRIFQNGNEMSYSTQSSGSGTDSPDSSHSLAIGSDHNQYTNNINASIDEFAVWNRSLSATEIESLYNYTKTRFEPAFQPVSFVSGDYMWNVEAEDNLSNPAWGAANYTFTIDPLALDSYPNVTLISPYDGYKDVDGNITFQCNATDDFSIANITLFGNFSGSWEANESITGSLGTSYTAEFNITLPEGDYIWNCEAKDNATQSNFSTANRTVISGTNAILSIWDDGDPEGGSQSLTTGTPVSFYANYSKKSDNSSLHLGRLLWNTGDVDTGDDTKTVQLFDYDNDSLRDEMLLTVYQSDSEFRAFDENGTEITDGDWPQATGYVWSIGAYATDVTGDGADELVIGNHHGLFVLNRSGTILWESDDNQDHFPINVVDLNDDNKTDIISNNQDSSILRAYNSTDGTILWSYQPTNDPSEILVGDLDRDGKEDDIFQVGYGQPAALDNDGTLLFNYTSISPGSGVILDLDHDGHRDEIIFSAEDSGDHGAVVWNGTYGAAYAPGDEIWGNQVPDGRLLEFDSGDFDADGWEDDYVTAETNDGGGGGKIWAFDNNSNHLWNYTVPGGSDVKSLQAGDFDGDGSYDVVFGTSTSEGGVLYMLNRTGNLTWSYNISKGDIGPDTSGDSPALQTAENANGVHKIAVASMDGYGHMFQATSCWIEFNDTDERQPMRWNSSLKTHTHERTFSQEDTVSYTISCEGAEDYDQVNLTDTATIQPSYTTLTNCSDINSSGEYYLDASITDAASTCFRINASHVIFDCQDHDIDGQSSGNGIFVDGSNGYLNNVTVRDCNINDFSDSFYAYYINDSEFTDIRTTSASDDGVYLQYVENSTLTNLNSTGNSGDGLYLLSSYNLSIFNLTSKDQTGSSDRGVYLYRSDNIIFDGGRIENNYYSLRVSDSDNFILTNLTIIDNDRHPFISDDSHNGLIYNNIFRQTAAMNYRYIQLPEDLDISFNTTLDCTQTNIIGGSCLGGNYWELYITEDSDTNGIGDYELYVGGDGIDHLPLVNGTNTGTHTQTCQYIDSPGSYSMNGSTSNRMSTCIKITSDNVTFDCEGNSIDSVDLSDAAIYAKGVNNVSVLNCEINQYYTLFKALDSEHLLVQDTNSSSTGTGGYHIENTNHSVFRNSYIGVSAYTGTPYGLVLDNSHNNNFTDLHITEDGAPDGGVSLLNSQYNIFDTLTIDGFTGIGDPGVLFDDGAHNNIIRNSVLTGNRYNIELDGLATNNSIYNNNITASTFYSIYNHNSNADNNLIYNNFMNNTDNVVNTGTSGDNDWNSTKTREDNIMGAYYVGGNYWANPTGTGHSENCSDDNQDGFCDTVNDLGEGEYDYLPLTLSGAQVNLTSPTDGQTIASTKVQFVANVTDETRVMNATLFTNESGSWGSVETRWKGEVAYNDTGLVLLMHFNNESGENDTYVRDWSGNGNNASCSNCPALNKSGGRFGNSFYFDGLDDTFSVIQDDDSLELAINFTISVWVKNKGDSILQGIVSKAYDTPWNMYAITIHYGNINIRHPGDWWDTNAKVNDDTWHFITYVYNGTAMLYVDGKFNTSYYNGTEYDTTGTTILKLGHHSSYFNGSIDEFAVWNRSLSSDEISDLYNYTKTRFEPAFQQRSLDAGDYLWNVYGCDNTDSCSWDVTNNSFTVSLNSAPDTPAPSINTTDGTNLTSQDVNCVADITDDDDDPLNVTVQWWKDGLINLTEEFNNSYSSGTLFNATLEAGNTTAGDNWSCSIRTHDGSSFSPWGYSENITIQGECSIDADCAADSECISSYCFASQGRMVIQNATQNITIIDRYGQIAIAGSLTQSCIAAPDGNDFTIDIGATVAWIDDLTGNMCIDGALNQNQGSITPDGNDFLIENQTEYITMIDTTGNLHTRKNLIENAQLN